MKQYYEKLRNAGMGLITLLTDFGYRDHYVAALKARLLQLAPAHAGGRHQPRRRTL